MLRGPRASTTDMLVESGAPRGQGSPLWLQERGSGGSHLAPVQSRCGMLSMGCAPDSCQLTSALFPQTLALKRTTSVDSVEALRKEG